MLSRRTFIAGSAALAAGAALGVYSWSIEPRWLEVLGRPLPVAGLPDALAGATLAHLTDIHVGRNVDDDYVAETFAKVTAMRPDIVAITGDLTTWHPGILQQAERVYAAVPRGRLATLAVLGNHDYGRGWTDFAHADKLAATLRDAGVTVLRNQTATVEGLQIAGLDDLWADRFDARTTIAGLDPTRPMIALNHNPDAADLDGWDGFDGWILSGHTHGGQVRLPPLPPLVLPVEDTRYTSGTFELSGGRRMYISKGVGNGFIHARLDVRPDVTVFTLERA